MLKHIDNEKTESFTCGHCGYTAPYNEFDIEVYDGTTFEVLCPICRRLGEVITV